MVTPAKDAGSNGPITVVTEVGPSLLAQPRIAPRNMIELTFYIRQTENRTTPRSLTKTKAKSFNVDLSLSHVCRIPEPKCRTCHPPFQHYCMGDYGYDPGQLLRVLTLAFWSRKKRQHSMIQLASIPYRRAKFSTMKDIRSRPNSGMELTRLFGLQEAFTGNPVGRFNYLHC